MSSCAELLLPPQQNGLAALPPSIADLLDTLSQAAAALHLADTRPASLAAAARQAASAAQDAQDREEAAFDVGTQLAARLAAVRAALAELQSLAQRLDAVAEERRKDVERWQGEAQPADARTAGYAVRQQQIEARLATLQLSPEIMQMQLHAQGKRHTATAAELVAVERQLEPYGGLPADVAGAEAAIQAKRGELARLRQRLQANLEGME